MSAIQFPKKYRRSLKNQPITAKMGQFLLTPILLLMMILDLYIILYFISFGIISLFNMGATLYFFFILGFFGAIPLMLFYVGGSSNDFNKLINIVAGANFILIFFVGILSSPELMVFYPSALIIFLILILTTNYKITFQAPILPTKTIPPDTKITAILLFGVFSVLLNFILYGF